MKKISLAILLVMAMLLTLLPTAAMALEEVPEVVLPDGVTESNFGNNVVLFNNTYYSSIQSALAAAIMLASKKRLSFTASRALQSKPRPICMWDAV